MNMHLRASLAAVLCLYAGTALAGSAVLNSDMTAFEGPGDTYRPVLHLVAGQRVDILECDAKQWCRVEHDGQLGWVHAKLASPSAAGAGASGKPGQPGSDIGDSASGGGTGSGKGGSPRPTFSTVGGGITMTDDGSKGGGGLAARKAASASSGGFDSSDSPPASVATEAAKAPSCLRC